MATPVSYTPVTAAERLLEEEARAQRFALAYAGHYGWGLIEILSQQQHQVFALDGSKDVIARMCPSCMCVVETHGSIPLEPHRANCAWLIAANVMGVG